MVDSQLICVQNYPGFDLFFIQTTVSIGMKEEKIKNNKTK